MSQTRRPRTSGLQGYGALPAKMIAPEKERFKKALKRGTVRGSVSAPKNTKDTPSKHAQERPEKAEQRF